MLKALVIVDLQNDFLPHGALGVAEGDLIIPFINELQHDFDLVLATKDWHPPHHISFGTSGTSILIEGKKQELWPPHCIQGTLGAELAPKLETAKIAKIFYKGTDPKIDSYSAFFDNAHLKSTGLGQYLREKGVEEVAIVGLATDFCVKYSVLDALKEGFKVTVYLKGCKGIDLNKGDVERAKDEMRRAGAHLIN